MIHKQFRHDLRRGLGRCHQIMEHAANIEDYREDVLWGFQHAIAYDSQCEGARAIYLVDLIDFFDDWSDFFTVAETGAKRHLKDRGGRFSHFAEILAIMSGCGYLPAYKSIRTIYELLLHELQVGHPSKSGNWPTSDNFNLVCVTTLTNVLQTQSKRESFYLQVLTDYGKLLANRPALSSWFMDEWLDSEAEEYLGIKRVHELLEQERGNPDIARYLENKNSLMTGRETYLNQSGQQASIENAQSIYSKLRDNIAIKGELSLLRRISMKQGTGEIKKLAYLYAGENHESLRESILRLFREKDCISIFEADGISRLIADAESGSISIRNEALRVLADIHDHQVREYALVRLERSPKDIPALYMLITNYQTDDKKLLISLIKSVSLNEYRGDWHEIFSRTRDLIESDKTADRDLSKALLPYMFHENYCSCCRLFLLELMQPRGLLTPELVEECRWDCYMEIREFVNTL